MMTTTPNNEHIASSLNVLLTGLYPRPECCVDTEEYGTFVLQGFRLSNGDIQMGVESLSTLQHSPTINSGAKFTDHSRLNKTNFNDEWKRVALWSSSATLTTIPVAKKVKSIPNLQQRLQDVLDEKQAQKRQQQLEPAHAFLESARAVFKELMEALSSSTTTRHQRHDKNESSSSSRNWSSANLLQLHHQLDELESTFSPAAIELSSDLMTLTLQAEDAAQRLHTMVLDLSHFDTSSSANDTITIKRWQVPQSDTTSRHTIKAIHRDNNKRQRRNELPKKETTASATKSKTSVLDFYDDFQHIIKECQDLWNQLDDLDSNTWVLLQDSANVNRSNCQRRICLRAPREEQQQQLDWKEGATDTVDDDAVPTTIVFTLEAFRPRRRPAKFHILGGSSSSRAHRETILDDFQWNDTLMVRENLERCFGNGSLAKPKDDDDDDSTASNKNSTTSNVSWIDCGICFGPLPSDAVSSSEVTHCENLKCVRPYHKACLSRWLAAAHSTRMSFDSFLGECVYCRDYISVLQQEDDDRTV